MLFRIIRFASQCQFVNTKLLYIKYLYCHLLGLLNSLLVPYNTQYDHLNKRQKDRLLYREKFRPHLCYIILRFTYVTTPMQFSVLFEHVLTKYYTGVVILKVLTFSTEFSIQDPSSFFFFFHVQGPERMFRIHCSLKAYCARPYIVF
jgi:hypothetical protein